MMQRIMPLLLGGMIGFSIAVVNHLVFKTFTRKALKKTYSISLALILSSFLFRLTALGIIFFMINILWGEGIYTTLIFFLVGFHILLIREGSTLFYNRS